MFFHNWVFNCDLLIINFSFSNCTSELLYFFMINYFLILKKIDIFMKNKRIIFKKKNGFNFFTY